MDAIEIKGKKSFVIFILIGVFGIDAGLAAEASAIRPADQSVTVETIVNGKHSKDFDIADIDRIMNNAVYTARKTVGKYIVALQHPSRSQRLFAVKKRFVEGTEVEYLWLSHVSYSDNRFHGRVNSHPNKIRVVKMDDLVTVKPNEISDWAYLDRGKLVGGYTIGVLNKEISFLGRMTE